MKWKYFGVLISFLIAALAPSFVGNYSVVAKTIDEDTLYYYGLNGIYFYNGKAEKCGVNEGGNQNYAGATVWSEAELSVISENQPIYEEAAEQYDFPWQILAVVHSMETGLRRYNPTNGQGVYQLYSYTGGGANSNRFTPSPSITEAEFRQQTMVAAEVINNMAGGADLNDEDNIKQLFFRFNGTSATYVEKAIKMGFSEAEAKNGEGSAYVMNRYDEQRDPTSSNMSSYWPGRYVSDGVYDTDAVSTSFGAFVKYEALAGNSYCANNSGEIVETAITLSWPGIRSHDKDDPKPEYVKAMKEVGTYYAPCRSSGDCAPYGASCDIFVSTVMRYSGSDTNFPATGPGVQEQYMRANTDKYTQVEATNVSDLQPGDILVTASNGRHIYLYLGEIDGQQMQASASYNDRTGEHFFGVYLVDSGTGNGARYYNVYRRIN